jgi:two-component system, NarL family, nitrate/nitrite response regulator NarL
MIRALVADNSSMHTRLLADALRRDQELEVICFDSGAGNLVSAVTTHKVDVLVVSSNLDEQPSRGIDILRELRTLRPDTRAVVLLDSSKDETILEAFRAGARAVFGRNEPIELLIQCVRCVHKGEFWANNHQFGIAIDALAKSPTFRAVNADGMSLLSERELQVVRCLAEGLSNREIADRLKLSQHTIKNYLFRVFDKLGVSSRVELLYMTLNGGITKALAHDSAIQVAKGNGYSSDESELLTKSAEAGLPAAQLALAQLHLSRRGSSQDLVEGCMWYLVAIERAELAREFIMKMMTPQEIEQAKQKAAAWLPKGKRPPLASSVNSPEPTIFCTS